MTEVMVKCRVCEEEISVEEYSSTEEGECYQCQLFWSQENETIYNPKYKKFIEKQIQIRKEKGLKYAY